jgi:uncharacterized protein with NAD-binding domain and iron-sulfur cluster
MADPSVRVAIVGGGCAGMAAAWELSKQPGFEIHVYEKSWRLGGKAASARAVDGRILEHGLHVWLGFYESAFRMMRECYTEVAVQKLGPKARLPQNKLAHGCFEDAFVPEPNVGVGLPNFGGKWAAWSALFPPEPGLPGDPLDERSSPFTLANYSLRCLSLLKALMVSTIGPPGADNPGDPRPNDRSSSDHLQNLNFSADSGAAGEVLIERAYKLLRGGSLTSAAVLQQAVTILERWLQSLNFAPQAPGTALKLATAIATQTRKILRDAASIDPAIRAKADVIDIVVTSAVGLFRDRVLFGDKGLDAINKFEYKEWLERHGATKTSIDSPFLQGIYELVFGYKDGDKKKPALAAGVALRGALRMFFTYRGALLWRMPSGMGDAVFAPLYKVLEGEVSEDNKAKRPSPVKFHFLHELIEVVFDSNPGPLSVLSITFNTQKNPADIDRASGSALDDFGCWPEEKRSRIGNLPADKGRVTLRRGDEDGFDAVIFAGGIDGFKLFGTAAGKRLPPAWDVAIKQSRTVATQSAQVWLSEDLEGLGWHRGSGLVTAIGGSVLATARGSEFDTWADMTNTLASERTWRKATGANAMAEGGKSLDDARSVAYFCSTLLESEVKAAAKPGGSSTLEDKINSRLNRLLEKDIEPLWPDAFEDHNTAKTFEIARHVQANFEGSDRYVQSPPGSLSARISPLDRSVDNMTVAGDWTASGLDAGCVEAAVMSGILAAYAISGKPDDALDLIVGYDHP